MMYGNEAQKVALPECAAEKIIGANHLRRGKPCQDDVASKVSEEAIAVAVADGHGSSLYSDIGAKVAVEVAVEALLQFIEDLGEQAQQVSAVHEYANHPFRVHLVREWRDRVSKKSSEEELDIVQYGSTLLFALSTPQILLLGQLGDGDLLFVHEDGRVSTPIPADPGAFADETPSLC